MSRMTKALPSMCPASLKVSVTPGMIWLCVGIEHIDDIVADLAQALG